MRPITSACLLCIAGAALATAPLSSQTEKPYPLTVPLVCAQGDCPILKGAPQTTGMRSGFVHLQPGETVGWHTTGKNEEALVVLHGEGKALIEGQPGLSFVAPALVYIPPATRHNVEKRGKFRWNTSTSSRPPKRLGLGSVSTR